MERRVFLIVAGTTVSFSGCIRNNETKTESVPEFRLIQEESLDSPVISGTNTSVTLTVENTGTGSGETAVEFETEGISRSEQVTLSAGTSESVTFEFQISEIGTYTYTVTETANGDSITRDFEVVDPVKFNVGGMSISPNNPVPNENMTLSVQIENLGGIEGSTTVEFETADINQSEEITLPAENSDSVTFEFQIPEPGTYTYTVTESATGESKTGDLEVATPTAFEYSDLEITPENPEPGEEITASVLVENTGGVEGRKTIEFEVGDDQFTDDVMVAPGESETASFTFSTRTQSEYTVLVAGLSESVTTEYEFDEIGKPYEAPDGLTVTLESFEIVEKPGSYEYQIQYLLENNTDEKVDEGMFKLYEDEPSFGEAQSGSFGEVFPNESEQRSYTFKVEKTIRFEALAYAPDQTLATTPPSDALVWPVEY